MPAASARLHRLRRLLCGLQDSIRERLAQSRRLGSARLSRVAYVTAADTIYAVDKISEAVVLGWLKKNWPRHEPVELVMEGLEGEAPTTFPPRTPVDATKWKLILDPIDGTRMLMHDKRSAWSLAALAPQRGPATNLSDILVAAMTELPAAKAGWADQLSAVRGDGVRATRLDLRTGRARRFAPRPSQARDVTHGFASFAKFFPEGKTWLADLEERLWRDARVPRGQAGAPVFDDQYLSSGGQIYELLAGHDRFTADLRPLAFSRLGLHCTLTCHPYDICTALIAQEAGCIITAPDGRSLNTPLDTTTPVAWVGYANRTLARHLGPLLRRLLAR